MIEAGYSMCFNTNAARKRMSLARTMKSPFAGVIDPGPPRVTFYRSSRN